ncbi:MAG: iron transporter [Burkholderiaceae bacterium]|nr:iron transporter [Burkholderiaceae bacterium]
MERGKRKWGLAVCMGLAGLLAGGTAVAADFEEFPIGEPKQVGPLKIKAVYFKPVDMEPHGQSGLPASKADMHVEADIAAVEGNKLGYPKDAFVPYLTVKYVIAKQGGKTIRGSFMPMNASDGPHYGSNLKLDGAGKYKVTFIIENPEKQGFLLHTDKTTGVPGRFWKEPIEVSWDFNYIPRVW